MSHSMMSEGYFIYLFRFSYLSSNIQMEEAKLEVEEIVNYRMCLVNLL